MSLLADLLSTVFKRRYRGAQHSGGMDASLPELAEALLGARGEVSGYALADAILSGFARLDDAGKLEFFGYIAHEMDIAPEALRGALDAYEGAPSAAHYRKLVAASEPRRREFLRRLNGLPGATEQLVFMRAELLRLGGRDGDFAPLDVDFQHLFATWFNRGFLVLRPINWESPAHILEKIIAYEAVHAIDSWKDLRRRLEPQDRRCFAFFHPAMPDEPLIFVEVALTQGIATSIQNLLAETREGIGAEDADTAMFYSISNCQKGLANISFGNSLIKQVAADLAAELPRLKHFATLSPMPNLMRWLEQEGREGENMRGLAAEYLLNAKRGDGQPYDAVARFHLGNGAQIYAIHENADVSERGVAQSAGVMVNYLYDLEQVESNHEQFVANQKIAATSEVKKLADAK